MLEVVNVNKIYGKKDKAFNALSNISLSFDKGTSNAIVGKSGSGKSTLVKLLVGLYRPQEGNIFYNQINGKEFDFDELRNQIGFVTQDTQLFAGTIKENLLFVNPNASEEDIQLALKKSSTKNLLERAEKALKP